MSSGDTVVQTRLPPEEYERLRRVAEAEGKTLKAALREAAREYADARARPDPDDPFFTVEVPDSDGPTVSATETDDLLYGDPTE